MGCALICLAGLTAAVFQHEVASRSASCKAGPGRQAARNPEPGGLAPGLHGHRQLCRCGDLPPAGLPYEVWSGLLFCRLRGLVRRRAQSAEPCPTCFSRIAAPAHDTASCLTRLLLSTCLLLGAHARATAVETHGALSVRANRIVGSHGQPVSLAGPTCSGATRAGSAAVLHRRCGGLCTAQLERRNHPRRHRGRQERRLAGLTGPPTWRGWKPSSTPPSRGGMYVLVDYHSHDAEKHPSRPSSSSRRWRANGKHPNLIYRSTTSRSGHGLVHRDQALRRSSSRASRAIDPHNLIIVGTQSWSQEVDKAARDPLRGFSNIVYALLRRLAQAMAARQGQVRARPRPRVDGDRVGAPSTPMAMGPSTVWRPSAGWPSCASTTSATCSGPWAPSARAPRAERTHAAHGRGGRTDLTEGGLCFQQIVRAGAR